MEERSPFDWVTARTGDYRRLEPRCRACLIRRPGWTIASRGSAWTPCAIGTAAPGSSRSDRKPSMDIPPPPRPRRILHVDVDAMFVQCAIMADPEGLAGVDLIIV